MLSKHTNDGMEPTECPLHCPYTPHTHSEDLLQLLVVLEEVRLLYLLYYRPAGQHMNQSPRDQGLAAAHEEHVHLVT